MWRKLRDEEKNILIPYYQKSRAFIVLFMGIWLTLGIIFEIVCLYSIITSFIHSDFMSGFGGILGGILLSSIFIILPIFVLRNALYSEIKAIKSDTAWITEAYYVSSNQYKHRHDGKIKIYYKAVVYTVDEFGHSSEQFECDFMSHDNPDNYCQSGERILLFLPDANKPTELLAFKPDYYMTY